ncbi:ORF52 [Felid gammaherpesvirus 1]|uniref:ORF52 n=1 Tax=Felid gammaherpesvirus 1 TaxID=2560468 RepID=A0A0M3T9D2_9GAMA|nr:ORF52 [Felis catus gammaherpesvirus 1]ALE14766.1 ORF52 [Felis catus gammaherpesvirus 1]
MASKKGTPTHDDLVEQLEKLKIENKNLKKKLKKISEEDGGTGVSCSSTLLTENAKKVMVSAVTSMLTKQARDRIEQKVMDITSSAVTKEDFEKAVNNVTMRIEVSTAEGEGRATSRKSRTRARSKSRSKQPT